MTDAEKASCRADMEKFRKEREAYEKTDEYKVWLAKVEADKAATKAREDMFCAKFPELMRDLSSKNKSEPIGWNGIETPTVWDGPVVLPLLEEIAAKVRPLNLPADSWPRVMQIKSKFASLRCYLATGDVPEDVREELHKIVMKYEGISAKTSEISGKPGELFCDEYWWIVMTPEEIEEAVQDRVNSLKKSLADPQDKYPGFGVVFYKTNKHGTKCVTTIREEEKVAAWKDANIQKANDVELIKIWTREDLQASSGTPAQPDVSK